MRFFVAWLDSAETADVLFFSPLALFSRKLTESCRIQRRKVIWTSITFFVLLTLLAATSLAHAFLIGKVQIRNIALPAAVEGRYPQRGGEQAPGCTIQIRCVPRLAEGKDDGLA